MLADADVLFSATAAPGILLGPEDLRRARAKSPPRPLLIVDAAVPRDVDPAVASLPDVTLRDVDDLRALAERSMATRRAEIDRVQVIIDEELGRYFLAARGRAAAPVVAALHDHAEQIRAGELARISSVLARLGEDERAAVESATRRIVAKLVHEPTVQVKRAAGSPRGERLAEALRGAVRPVVTVRSRAAASPRAPRGCVVRVLRLATRGSPLALEQARRVQARLAAVHAGLPTELVVVESGGDLRAAAAIHSLGGSGAFVAEIEQAVLAGRADVAVHSLKDLPSSAPPAGLVLAATPERLDVRDALVGRTLARLAPGAVVATGAVRRRAQLAWLRPDLCFAELRGSIATRVLAGCRRPGPSSSPWRRSNAWGSSTGRPRSCRRR